MIFDLDELLAEVDRWKVSVHEELRTMTANQRRSFWDRATKEARQAGFPVVVEKIRAVP